MATLAATVISILFLRILREDIVKNYRLTYLVSKISRNFPGGKLSAFPERILAATPLCKKKVITG